MKKALVFLLIVLLFAMMFSFVQAEEKEPAGLTSGDWEYIIREDGTAEIARYHGEADEFSVPEELDGKKVTGIGDRAFDSFKSLTSVTIPDSVTSIGNYAFGLCSSLTSVTIPDSVTSIGVNPFAVCGKLTDIRISPDHPYLAVTDGVLFSKPDNRLVCYPESNKTSEYTIPQGTRIIGDYAFVNASFLTSVTIPDSIISIGERAFAYCSSLTTVTIPGSVTGIGDNAFAFCSSMTSVVIPDSVTTIGSKAFYDCESLTVTVGRNSYAEQYCEKNGIKYIYADANDWLNE